MSTEAHLIEVIRDLATDSAGGLAIGDIATRFVDRFGGEYERPITPRWIGTVLRRRLHLSPHKSNGRYLVAIDQQRLAALCESYGVADRNARDAHEPEGQVAR